MTKTRNLILAWTMLCGISTAFANDANFGTGTVSETMESGGYVYVYLDESGKWLATRPVPVAVGDKVSYSGGMTMKDFHSRTLNRTFPWIVFVTTLEATSPATPQTHPPISGSMSGMVRAPQAEAPKAGEIAAAEGGKSIADILAESSELKDQEISLRAKVMMAKPSTGSRTSMETSKHRSMP